MSNEAELKRLAKRRDRLKGELDAAYNDIADAVERARGDVLIERIGEILGVSRAGLYDLLKNRR